MKRYFSAPRRTGIDRIEGIKLAGKEVESNVEAIKIIGIECGLKDATNLFAVANNFQFFRGAANGKIIDDDLALLEGALRDTGQFSQLQIAEALNADPDSGPEHSEHQT